MRRVERYPGLRIKQHWESYFDFHLYHFVKQRIDIPDETTIDPTTYLGL